MPERDDEGKNEDENGDGYRDGIENTNDSDWDDCYAISSKIFLSPNILAPLLKVEVLSKLIPQKNEVSS